MLAIIGAVSFLVVIVMSFLLICGVPLGEFTMGGQLLDNVPKKFRVMIAVSQLIVQLFFTVVVLQAGGIIPLWFSEKVTKIICIVMAVYLSLNTVMNLFSKSKKEKLVMTPIALVSAICFWITALQM